MAGESVQRGLRAELGELRAQLAERDRALVVLTEENAALRGQVSELREQLAELARRLGRNPRNSHQPPSSEGYDKPAPKSRRERGRRAPGGQPGHDGRTLRQVEDPDEVRTHTPRRCSCGRGLRHAPVVCTERRQVIDLPEIRPHVTEHRFERRACRCGRVVDPSETDGAPAGVKAPVSYGPGVRALALYLLAGQHLPLARTAELLSDVLGLPVCEGSLAAWYTGAADDLDPFVVTVEHLLAAAPVLGADETGARVQGRLAWIHTLRTDALTLYDVYAGPGARGAAAMRAIGVLPAVSAETVLVTDFWAPYWEFELTHAVCAAHLGRELVAAAEVDGQAPWATRLDALLTKAIAAVRQAREDGEEGLPAERAARFRKRYGELVAAGWAANPDHRPATKGNGKRPKHVNLLDRLDTHREEVLRFLDDPAVPATNNGSEQDIRMVKVRLKVCGGLRTLNGAKAFCRLRSYLSTAHKQGQSALAVLRTLCEGNAWLPVAAA